MNRDSTDSAATAAPPPSAAAFRAARVIASAMPAGVIAFWVVGWVLTEGGARGQAEGALDARTAFWLWLAVAFVTLAGAVWLRARATTIAYESARSGAAGSRVGEVQSRLVIAWALIEAQGLLAGLLLFVLGLEEVLWYAAPLYLIGLALTFPRAEWFGVDPRAIE